MAVPVQNIYYLLCYAWNRLEARDLVDVEAIPGNRVENLLGKVLQEGVSNLIRRGLDRGYIAFEEDGRRLRGKLLLSDTVKRSLLPQGRVVCHFDDLSYDVPHNRVIKAAMRALIGVPELDSDIRTALRDHCRRLHTVSDVELTPAAFRQIQFHRNVARYSFLVNIAQLVARSFFPDGKTGQRRFRPFTASEQAMGLLFQAFVRNFLQREQDIFKVSAPKVPWDLTRETSSDPTWLPEMHTDVVLTSPWQRVVIETKYYATPYQSHHGSKKVISGHLYQILTYLEHFVADNGPKPVGVLLYARAGDGWRLRYQLRGHTLLVHTLDLDCEWREIHRSLLGLAHELEDSPQRSTAGTCVEAG
jgi:5-methylcytosine-specific restriction enzyme subunit McrC